MISDHVTHCNTLSHTVRYKYIWDSCGLECLPNTPAAAVFAWIDIQLTQSTYFCTVWLEVVTWAYMMDDRWKRRGEMKQCSNDDILNCDVPINRPGKVPLISVAVRDEWFLEKVTQSHNVIIGCAFYIVWDWFPMHRLNCSALCFLWWKPVSVVCDSWGFSWIVIVFTFLDVIMKTWH